VAHTERLTVAAICRH